MSNKLKTREELEHMTETELANYAAHHHYMLSPENVPFLIYGGSRKRFIEGWNFIDKRTASKILAKKCLTIHSIKAVFHNYTNNYGMITKDSHSFYTPECFDWTIYGK